MKKSLAILLPISVLFCTSVADAAVTVKLSGRLFQVSPSVSSKFFVGDTVSADFKYDPRASVTSSSMTSALYNNSVFSGRLTIGSYLARFSEAARIFVNNDEPSGLRTIDRFIVDDLDPLAPPVNGLPINGLFFNFQDNGAGILSSTSLFDATSALTQFPAPSGAIDWSTNDGANRVTFSITTFSVSSVPEPSTWASMLMGFLLIGLALRRRHGSKRPKFRLVLSTI